MRARPTIDTRSSSTCAGAGFSSVVRSRRRSAPRRCAASPRARVVRAADRHLERAREARLVRARLALERRESGPNCIAPDRVDPARRERHEVVGLDLRRPRSRARSASRRRARECVWTTCAPSSRRPTAGTAANAHRPAHLCQGRGAGGSCRGESKPVAVGPLVLVAVQGARSLHAAFRFVTAAASCNFGPVRLPALSPVPPRTAFYSRVALLATAPAWIVRHPPLQDLPFHVATLRAIHSYSDPAYGFTSDFFLNLVHTQYALYYVVGSVLAYVRRRHRRERRAHVRLPGGHRPGAARAARGARQGRAAMPLRRAAARQRDVPLRAPAVHVRHPAHALGAGGGRAVLREPTRGRGALLAALAVALFYSHVVPVRPLRARLRGALPVAPPGMGPRRAARSCRRSWPSRGGSSSRRRARSPRARSTRRSGTRPTSTRWPVFPPGRSTSSATRPTSVHALALAVVVLLAMASRRAIAIAQARRARARPHARRVLVLYFSTGECSATCGSSRSASPCPA